LKSNQIFDIKKIEAVITGLLPELIAFRRELHGEPEIAWEEHKTTSKIENFLKNHGLQRIAFPLKTGLVAEMVRDRNIPYLGLRAEIDALPIPDEKKVDYRSVYPGMCHACGHDIHTTVVCGVAAALQVLDVELPLNLRFLFQPAEEPIPSGAPRMIEKGVLDNLNELWAMHVDPNLPFGTLSLTEGWVNAQSIRLNWEIAGRGGHSAQPELSNNPIPVCARLIQDIQRMVTDFNGIPEDIKILAFTRIFSSDTSYNTIPDNVRMTATLRVNKEELGQQMISRVQQICAENEKKESVKIKFTFIAGAPPVVNDLHLIRRFKSNLQRTLPGHFRVVENIRSRGGDDFGWYMKSVSGVLIRFGIARDKNQPLLHTTRFDVPEEIISKAILFFIIQILNWNDA
jgi:amidohydrolase